MGVAEGDRYNPFPRSSGAGRLIDILYPDPGANLGNGTSLCITRGGVQKGTTSIAGGGGAGNSYMQDGETVQLIRCFAAADFSARKFDCIGIDWRSLKASWVSPRDYQVWRLSCCMGATMYPVDFTRDYGFQIERANGGVVGMFKNNLDGFAFRPMSLNVTRFVVRGPNGLVGVDLAVNDTTKLHRYELRIIGATATQNAQLKVYIDGVLQNLPAAFSSWDAGTNLPSCQWIANVMNFVPIIVNGSGNVVDNSLCVKDVRLMCAPTEADTL